MGPGRLTAVATALLLAALAAAGCGLGPGEDLGDVSLTVTRDYGSERVVPPASEEVDESDTVMRVLEGGADISTRYGGGFVQSIDGLEAEEGSSGPLDWFFYVNGVESTVGAADSPLSGGEAIWWDYRDWGSAMRVPAVVGSWPQPLTGGYDGDRHPVALLCRGGEPAATACAVARDRLEAAGVEVAAGDPRGAIRVLVGPWAALLGDPAAAGIADGPEKSGVFAEIEARGGGYSFVGLGEDGEPARVFGPRAGLVAATRRYDAPPTWVVTGADVAGATAAARLLDVADLRDHYAVATEDGTPTPLPVE